MDAAAADDGAAGLGDRALPDGEDAAVDLAGGDVEVDEIQGRAGSLLPVDLDLAFWRVTELALKRTAACPVDDHAPMAEEPPAMPDPDKVPF